MRWLDDNLFRPPAEAHSLIFQISRGCPHNKCLFCGMYKGIPYTEYSLDKIRSDVDCAIRDGYGDAQRIFLADANGFAIDFGKLENILQLLNERFPRLSRVSFYADGPSILSKTGAELERLKELKVSTLYLGLESGSEELLALVHKGCTAEEMTRAVRHAQAHGLKCSVMILIGLGGKHLTGAHAKATADVLNQMQPKLLSALRYIEIPGLQMFKGYETLSEKGSAVELLEIIRGLRLEGTVFRANHSSIPFPLEGRFPKDRLKLIHSLEALINSGILSESGPGPVPLFL